MSKPTKRGAAALKWPRVVMVNERRFRALEAVARAAERLTKPPAPCPPICAEWSAMFRALARLRRVSGGARTTKGGGR